MEDANPSKGQTCCKQCGNKNANSLVKCADGACDTWFCNNNEKNQNISHIVRHMKTHKHNSIKLHPSNRSLIGDFICSKCGTCNVFTLGHLDSLGIICRACMLSREIIRINEWQPFIQQDRLRPDLLASQELELDQNKPSEQQGERNNKIIPQTPKIFSTRSEYYKFFSILLNEEMREELKIKNANEVKGVRIYFDQSSYICLVDLENQTNLSPGEVCEIRNNTKNTQAQGHIRSIDSGKIRIEFSKKAYKKLIEDHRKPSYTIKFKVNRDVIQQDTDNLSWHIMIKSGSFNMEKYALGPMLKVGTVLILKNQTNGFEDRIIIKKYKNEKVNFKCSIQAEDGESSINSLYDVRLHYTSVVYSRMNKALSDFTRRKKTFFFSNLVLGHHSNRPIESDTIRTEDQTSNYAILGDEATISAFLVAGFVERNSQGDKNSFAVRNSTPRRDIEEAFRKFVSRTDIKILLIDELIAERILKPMIDNYQEVTPAIMKIPSYNKLKFPTTCPELNESQLLAVYRAICSEFLLVQGPPGTGKTTTASVIILNLFKLYGKVLIAAPSNNAADELTSRLEGTDLNITRLYSQMKEDIGDMRHENISLHKKQEDLIDRLGRVENPDNRIKKKKKIENAVDEILRNTDVLVCTCAGAYDERISNFNPVSVLIDESTQAKEPECLMPMLKAAKKIIMIGDHLQLAPICFSNKAHNSGLSLSLFERLVKNENQPHILDTQYRMNPDISCYSNELFYKGLIKDATVKEGVIEPWGSIRSSMFFYDVPGKEEASASSTSYINRQEAKIVLDILQFIINQHVPLDRIQVVAFYEGQREYLEQYLNSMLGTDIIEVHNVDSCQGREYDYVILSCSRANEKGKVGFLHHPGRLNVSITRARFGNIIVGNAKALAKGGVWGKLLGLLKRRKLVLGGDVRELKPSQF
jgi:regulator of nonsense transcripts 1